MTPVFGTYDLDIELTEQDIELSVKGEGKRKRYHRRAGDEEVEKYIHADRGKLIICPVEPVNAPDESISEHLLVELERSLLIEPGSTDTFFLKFPVEIGSFLVDPTDMERIDIFTLTRPKYTLYGPPESGIVCKWWKSDVYSEAPEVDRLFEGVLRVKITNNYREWMELEKVVFGAFDMKIFYNEHAYMDAHLTIEKRTLGETSFNARKPKDMHRAIDIYQAKGLKKLEKSYVIEWGFK
ncbi:MAG: DUF432 domain-containing protein [Thermoplasmatota archaeon]